VAEKPEVAIPFAVPDQWIGERIDRALAAHPLIQTRSQATRLLRMGRVRLKGRVVKPSLVVEPGLIVELLLDGERPQEPLTPLDLKLDIPYEDEDLLIVNKPAGLVVHPAYGHTGDTLVNALLSHTNRLASGFSEDRPGLVHRIDKETSGLLVIAKTDAAQRHLSLQFQARTTYRRYLAIVYGWPRPRSGRIESRLARHPADRKRVASLKGDDERGGKNAVTHYRVWQEHPAGLSHLVFALETGRTHQIRVHISEKGNPIIGDVTYGSEARIKSVNGLSLRKMISELGRFALHAAELGFVHPSSGEPMRFSTPWPSEMHSILDHCGFSHDPPTASTEVVV
jgi:23S rRNA pseudouridine1911/1915/1917 synthase